jgi:N-acetylneuraminic acid mutarotase
MEDITMTARIRTDSATNRRAPAASLLMLILPLLILAAFGPAQGAVPGWANTLSLVTGRSENTTTLLPNGKVLVAGGRSGASSYLMSAELYDPATQTWTATGDMATARANHTATLLSNGKVLVAGGEIEPGNYLDTYELYDPAAGTWSHSTNTLTTGRRLHTATLLPDGRVLAAGGQTSTGISDSSELYDPATDTWSSTVNTLQDGARWSHTATLLGNGKVLVVGGRAPNLKNSAELFDYTTATWTETGAGYMSNGRASHTATLLPNGKVLVSGGVGSPSGFSMTSAELYDPENTTTPWSLAGDMSNARHYHTAALLPHGKVLVAGGLNYNGTTTTTLNSAELYDPDAPIGTAWSSAGTLATGRYNHQAALLPNGKLLVAAGWGQNGALYLNSAELYTPMDWRAMAAPLEVGRYAHTATRLPNGKILVAGGWGDTGGLAGSVVYDPTAGTWSATSNQLTNPRSWHTATLLANGKVLVTGGQGQFTMLKSGELYDPGTNSWSDGGTMNDARGYHTATLLPNGKVLVAGGYDTNYHRLASAELYDPANTTAPWSSGGTMNKSRVSHTATLLGNGRVLVVGGKDDDLFESAELYDPTAGSTGSWSDTSAPATDPRYAHTATLLGNGKVLVAGGYPYLMMNSSWLYDPANSVTPWSNAGNLIKGRYLHTATLLGNGKVLLAGGYWWATGTDSTELYDPTQTAGQAWSKSGNLFYAGGQLAAALLGNGKVLVAGGRRYDGSGSPLKNAQIFPPAGVNGMIYYLLTEN